MSRYAVESARGIWQRTYDGSFYFEACDIEYRDFDRIYDAVASAQAEWASLSEHDRRRAVLAVVDYKRADGVVVEWKEEPER